MSFRGDGEVAVDLTHHCGKPERHFAHRWTLSVMTSWTTGPQCNEYHYWCTGHQTEGEQ